MALAEARTVRSTPRLRVATRALAFGATTLAAGGALLVGLLLLLPAPRARARWASAVQGWWARLSLRILRLRVTVVGRPPRPPFFLVSNHLSYVDILVIASRVRCVFVSKAEVRTMPVLGFLSRAAGTIFVDRSRKKDVPRVLRALESAFAVGRGVVLFPEGTSGAGDVVQPFRSPLLALPAQRGEPVYAGALAYRTPPGERPASEAICWWSDTPIGPHAAGVLALPGFEAELAFSPTPIHHADRKELATRLWQEVARLHGGLTRAARTGEPPATC